MLPAVPAVYPALGVLVHRAKAQPDILLMESIGQGKAPLVPHNGVLRLVLHPGMLALIAKRHGNDQGKGLFGKPAFPYPGVAVIKAEGPGAVEVQPVLAPEIGSGMFGTGDAHTVTSLFIN